MTAAIEKLGSGHYHYKDDKDSFKLFLGSSQPIFMIHDNFSQVFDLEVSDISHLPRFLGTAANIIKHAENFKEGVTDFDKLSQILGQIHSRDARLTSNDVWLMLSYFKERNSPPETVHKQFMLRGFGWLSPLVTGIYKEHPLLTETVNCILKFNKQLRLKNLP